MPLSSAERARLYRQRKKENEHNYAEYLQKERDRYKKRKEKGEIKLVADMSEREQRKVRRTWKLQKQAQRRKTRVESRVPDTPPPSPAAVRFVHPSRQRLRRDRAKAYRDLERMQKTVDQQKRMIERYRKRLYRMNQKNKNLNSPRTKTKSLLKGQKVDKHIRKTLLFHNVLVTEIKEKYKTAKVERTKHLIARSVCSKLLKKYRLQKIAKQQLGMSQRTINSNNTGKIVSHRKPRTSMIKKMQTEVVKFLCRDDNSRIKAGKKSTKTRAKVKQQVRLLNDSMKNLHLKFLSEDEQRKMSYSFFCRMKPFYVRQPAQSDRETFLCRRHENIQFKANKLKQMNVIQTNNLESLAECVTCCVDEIQCMYRTCGVCKTKKVETKLYEPGKMIEWFEWRTKKIERSGNEDGKNKKPSVSTMTVKEKMTGTIQQLIDEFNDELDKVCKHLFNITHQFKAIRHLKQNLTDKDVLIHIDFSENLVCKYASEIQTVHFGASQRQISLHTGVIYTKGNIQSFTSISDNLKHSPAGIWGHMCPVLRFVREKYPSAGNLFVLSDGPTTQYRCRENFFLLSKVPLEMGFATVNWNFMEAGHGKGAPDGIGAVIKREADQAVLHGNDVTHPESLLTCLKEKGISVTLFHIKDDDIEVHEKDLKVRTINAVPGTMKIHQIFTATSGEILHRKVSCFCKVPLPCQCHSPETVKLVDVSPQECSHESPTRTSPSSESQGKLVIDEALKGKHCVVLYDGKPYPGVVLDVEDGEIEVHVMHSIGKNRFFWPRMDDVLWYKNEQLVKIIDPPENVTSRHFQINKDVWADLESKLDL